MLQSFSFQTQILVLEAKALAELAWQHPLHRVEVTASAVNWEWRTFTYESPVSSTVYVFLWTSSFFIEFVGPKNSKHSMRAFQT